MNFSIRLKELREMKGVSQLELASSIGVGVSTVGMWESTSRVPAAKTLQKLIAFFGCSLDYLLGNSDDFGVAVQSVGVRELAPDEKELLARYRGLRSDVKEAFWVSLRAMSSASAEDIATKKRV